MSKSLSSLSTLDDGTPFLHLRGPLYCVPLQPHRLLCSSIGAAAASAEDAICRSGAQFLLLWLTYQCVKTCILLLSISLRTWARSTCISSTVQPPTRVKSASEYPSTAAAMNWCRKYAPISLSRLSLGQVPIGVGSSWTSTVSKPADRRRAGNCGNISNSSAAFWAIRWNSACFQIGRELTCPLHR